MSLSHKMQIHIEAPQSPELQSQMEPPDISRQLMIFKEKKFSYPF